MTKYHHLNVARAVYHIDPFMRVARVDKDLLFLLEPGINLFPCEGDIVFQFRAGARRVLKGEGGVLRDPVADLHMPKNTFAFPVRMGRVVARLETVHSHVLLREIVERQTVGFTEQHHVLTISNDPPVEIDAHPPRARSKLAAVWRNSKASVMMARPFFAEVKSDCSPTVSANSSDQPCEHVSFRTRLFGHPGIEPSEID
jgi:hypothetical protein